MRLRLTLPLGPSGFRSGLLSLAVLLPLLLVCGAGWASDPAPPPPGGQADAATPGGDMRSAGWLENFAMKLEQEAMSDISMLPDTPGAIARQWRSFDRNGSDLGTLINVGWVTLAACIALLAEIMAIRLLSGRVRRRMRLGPDGPTIAGLLLLLLYDAVGVAVFAAVFIYSRHWLMGLGVMLNLILLSAQVLIRWRAASLVVRLLLRPYEPAARLIDLPDDEARRLTRFLSATMLAVSILTGLGRYGLADVDSGAPHIIGLIVAALVCGLYALIVYRARAVAEALIRGSSTGLFGAFRAAVARAWLAIGMTAVLGLLLFFWFGLSLGRVWCCGAAVNTLAVLLVLLVLERLADRAGRDEAPTRGQHGHELDRRLVARSLQRILRASVPAAAVLALAWIWVEAIEMSHERAGHVMMSIGTAIGTVFVAFLLWELARLAVDRHMPAVAGGPRLPGDDDEEAAPGSRLQTVLPMLRAGFGVVIAIVAALVVLSHLGIDTAPLIAGAGVFGLA